MTALAEMTKRQTREAERRCIVSGETAPKHGLIRFVVGPDNVIAVSYTHLTLPTIYSV